MFLAPYFLHVFVYTKWEISPQKHINEPFQIIILQSNSFKNTQNVCWSQFNWIEIVGVYDSCDSDRNVLMRIPNYACSWKKIKKKEERTHAFYMVHRIKSKPNILCCWKCLFFGCMCARSSKNEQMLLCPDCMHSIERKKGSPFVRLHIQLSIKINTRCTYATDWKLLLYKYSSICTNKAYPFMLRWVLCIVNINNISFTLFACIIIMNFLFSLSLSDFPFEIFHLIPFDS